MTVRRVMGIETEYGISVPGHPNANAMLTSSQIVNAYAAAMIGRLVSLPMTFVGAIVLSRCHRAIGCFITGHVYHGDAYACVAFSRPPLP